MSVNHCDHCDKTGKLLTCGRCSSIKYCSAACQRAAWPAHKQTCRAPQSAARVVMCARDGCDAEATASCSQCGWKPYCGAPCQKRDWREGGHRQSCDKRALNDTHDTSARLLIMATTLRLHTQSCSRAGCESQTRYATAQLCPVCRNCYCTLACRDADTAHDCAACLQPNREARVLSALLQDQNSVVQLCASGCDSARLDPMLARLSLNPVILLSPCAHAPGVADGGPQEIMGIANEKYQEALAADADTLCAYLMQLEGLSQVTSTGRTQTRIPTTYRFLEETWMACRILIRHTVDQGAPPTPDVVVACAERAVQLLHYGEGLIAHFKRRPEDARGAVPFDELCLAFQMVRAIFLGSGG